LVTAASPRADLVVVPGLDDDLAAPFSENRRLRRAPVHESSGNAGPGSSTMMAIANAARWAEPATTEG